MHGTTAILRSASTVGNWPSCWKACGASARRSADGRIRRFKEGVGSNRPPLSWWVRCRDSDLSRPGDSRFGNSLFPQPVGGQSSFCIRNFLRMLRGGAQMRSDITFRCSAFASFYSTKENLPPFMTSQIATPSQQQKAPNGYPFEA